MILNSFSISSRYIMYVIIFWCYAVYNALLPFSVQACFYFSVLLAVIELSHKDFPYFHFSIALPRKENLKFYFFTFVAVLAIIILIKLSPLNRALYGDEIYHASSSQFLSMWLTDQGLSDHWLPFFTPETMYINALWIASFFIFLSSLFLILIFKKTPQLLRPVLLISAFLFLRFHTIINLEPHPPLRNFLMWLTSTFSGFANFGFRLPQFLTGIFFALVLQNLFKSKVQNFWVSSLMTLSIVSFPLFIHCATIVEFSIFSSVLVLYLLLVIWQDRLETAKDFFFIFLAISSCALIRQSVFILFVPFLAVFLYRFKLKVLWPLAPLFIMAPFLAKSVYLGTPATYMIENNHWLAEVPTGLFTRLYFGLLETPEIIYKDLSVLGIFGLIPFVLFLKKLYWKKCGMTVSLLALLFFSFFSIRPVLWGIGRYQLEWFYPFCVLGLYFVYNSLRHKNQKIALASTILVLNIYQYSKLGEGITQNFGEPYYPPVLSAEFYDTDGALSWIKTNHTSSSHYLLGTVYHRLFPEMLNGLTASEIQNSRQIFAILNNYDWTKKSYEDLRAIRVQTLALFEKSTTAETIRKLELQNYKIQAVIPSAYSEFQKIYILGLNSN